MDFLKKFAGGENDNQRDNPHSDDQQGNNQDNKGGFFGGISDKLNSVAGGGRESEKNEDMLDKGIDMFQEKVLGQGPQDNESAVEQAKDEQISDYIRGQFKSATGRDIPIEDKETRFG